jgi:hypothetical protein
MNMETAFGHRGRRGFGILAVAAALFLSGCSVTYIPVSWGMGERVKEISSRDELLNILFTRYDPKRLLLRVDGESFNEVLTADEAKLRLGAYRPEKKLVYRNLEADLDDAGLRDLLVHEVAHHVWFNFMNLDQQADWVSHLVRNPAPWQMMVRLTYRNPKSHDPEDFAYTIQFARPADIEMLADLGLMSRDEATRVIRTIPPDPLYREIVGSAEGADGIARK